MTFDDLFSKEPEQWGLRGDPYLWREMRAHLANRQVPSRASEIYDVIAIAFEELTGCSLKSREPIFVDRFAYGGMSSGHVDPEFWRTCAQQFSRKALNQKNRGNSGNSDHSSLRFAP
jgi:hypothetical protein